MEIKAELLNPTEEQRVEFIVENNHRNGYEIKEYDTEDVVAEEVIVTHHLEAWGYTEEEKEQQKKEHIAHLSLTRGDVFRGLLKAKGVTKEQIRAIIEALPETNDEETQTKQLALIDFDDSLNFYRGNSLIDTVGLKLGITSEKLDKFFETNDYKELMDEDTTDIAD